MAGGFNPRRAVHDRRNRRFFRKLAHYFIQRELSMACVGCGRCVKACHGDIGMPTVVEFIAPGGSPFNTFGPDSLNPANVKVLTYSNEIIPGHLMLDKIADETVATSVEDLLPFLEEKGHPALTMDPLF